MIKLMNLTQNMMDIQGTFTVLKEIKDQLDQVITEFKVERRDFKHLMEITKHKLKQNDVMVDFTLNSDMSEASDTSSTAYSTYTTSTQGTERSQRRKKEKRMLVDVD